MLINGLDAKATFGFNLTEAPGWRDLPPARYPTGTVPGRPGVVRLAALDEAPRKLVLRGMVIGTSAADARTKLDRLAVALRDPAGVRVVLDDNATRQYTGLGDLTVTAGAASMIERKLGVEITVTCLDPYAYDLTPTVVAFGGAGTACPLGTAPVRPVIALTATTTANQPIFTLLKSDNATVVGTLTLDFLSAGDKYVIDCAALTVKNAAGASVIGRILAGDFFTLDVAAQGDFTSSAWPRLKVTFQNSPTYTCDVTYSKAWR